MRQLQETFPGHSAFTPSNSAIWQRSSKYATSERVEYAASEHGSRGPATMMGRRRDADGPAPLVRRFVLGDDVRRDPAALIHLVAMGPSPLADSCALLAARPIALTAAANLCTA
jgi:hypothetical protein